MSLKDFSPPQNHKINFSEFHKYLALMAFVSIVVKPTKHEDECHIINLLLLFQIKIAFYIKFRKIII